MTVSGDPDHPEGGTAAPGSSSPDSIFEGGAPPKLNRERLARLFGIAPPTSTRDDLPDHEPPRDGRASADDWYFRNRPPHHG